MSCAGNGILLNKNNEPIPPPPLPPLCKAPADASQYPLYNLPVPYATSGLVQSQQQQAQQMSENLYGFTTSISQIPVSTSGPGVSATSWNKGQLDEMYCDRAFTMLQEGIYSSAGPTTSSTSGLGQPTTATVIHHRQMAQIGRKDSHNYELPFALTKPNDSTAF